MPKQHNLAALLSALTGICTAVIGFLVLLGWHTHNLWLLHLRPTFVAMAYNAALGFFLCGVGLLAITLRRPRLALVGGMYGVLCGSLTLGEYLFHRDFHIDELFMRAYTMAGVTHNARMAFNTALCLLLMGVFQLLYVRERKTFWLPFVSALIGSLVLGLGTVALTGYSIGVQSYYTWGTFTRMALHTALAFILFGTGVLAYVWQRSQEEPRPTLRWLPIPVSVGALSLTISLWQALIVEQRLHLQWLRHLVGTSALPEAPLLMSAFAPQAVLLIGIVLALLLALLVSLAQANQQRARQLGDTNQELTKQIQVRQETQTALQQANDTLENRVQERTAEIAVLNHHLRRAMTETHHRVKNNLQVISAMVDMQVMEEAEFVPMREMARLGQHVRALALIHDLLTHQAKTDDCMAELNMRATLQKLVPLLQAMLPDRRLSVRLTDMKLLIRPGTSLAILVNEMVSNASKHGRGDIEIALTQEGENGRLTVRDHGPGFPPDFDPQQAAHTGLDLIQSLTHSDLQGNVIFENAEDGGGRVIVTFPLNMPQEVVSDIVEPI